mgnify:CR=1 FL=1
MEGSHRCVFLPVVDENGDMLAPGLACNCSHLEPNVDGQVRRRSTLLIGVRATGTCKATTGQTMVTTSFDDGDVVEPGLRAASLSNKDGYEFRINESPSVTIAIRYS